MCTSAFLGRVKEVKNLYYIATRAFLKHCVSSPSQPGPAAFRPIRDRLRREILKFHQATVGLNVCLFVVSCPDKIIETTTDDLLEPYARASMSLSDSSAYWLSCLQRLATRGQSEKGNGPGFQSQPFQWTLNRKTVNALTERTIPVGLISVPLFGLPYLFTWYLFG